MNFNPEFPFTVEEDPTHADDLQYIENVRKEALEIGDLVSIEKVLGMALLFKSRALESLQWWIDHSSGTSDLKNIPIGDSASLDAIADKICMSSSRYHKASGSTFFINTPESQALALKTWTTFVASVEDNEQAAKAILTKFNALIMQVIGVIDALPFEELKKQAEEIENTATALLIKYNQLLR